MEQSTVQQTTPSDTRPAEKSSIDYADERKQNDSKRKWVGDNARQQYGSKQRRGDDNSRRYKKGDMGRGEYFRNEPDKRQKTDDSRQKREANANAKTYGVEFSKEEIQAEERKPKRKVAVLIGYSGTGYKGMQITPTEKTIEGDLFQAFIKAGAISKANADDPKKAGLVRCARTDKGVHAAGNMISLKLIVEDPEIVAKINQELSPQIRIWGIERTIGSFSCYQACDSRWYEYLIPSHAFLPPHPSSWLARKLEQYADSCHDRTGYDSRQAEVKGFWERVDKEDVKPILETIDEDIRWDVVKALQGEDEASAKAAKMDADMQERSVEGTKNVRKGDEASEETTQDVEEEETEIAAILVNDPDRAVTKSGWTADDGDAETVVAPDEDTTTGVKASLDFTAVPGAKLADGRPAKAQLTPEEQARQVRLRAATKKLRQAYINAMRRYRIPPMRVQRIQDALQKFVGTANYHNYTIQKTYRDPSAKRHIKSFVVDKKPILIGEGADDAEKSEWLSLKVHGQSFMMHQIRKMIGMVTLLVRSGSHLSTLTTSLGNDKFSIPKVPGLGLLLERPVFDSYNSIQAVKHEREPLRFEKFEKEMEEFKQREIYQRIFREEEERNEFGRFFNHVDNFKEGYFLYVTSAGLAATREGRAGQGTKDAAVDQRSRAEVLGLE